MKHFVLVCAMLAAGCASRRAEIELVNPSFETAADGVHPVPGWNLVQHAGVQAYDMAIDPQTAFAGHASFRIQRLREQHYGSVTQPVKLPNLGGHTLELNAALRTSEVGPKGWVLTTTVIGNAGSSVHRAPPLSGTHDFTRVTLRTTLPEGTQAVEIGAVLFDEGTAWLDDVHLRVVDN